MHAQQAGTRRLCGKRRTSGLHVVQLMCSLDSRTVVVAAEASDLFKDQARVLWRARSRTTTPDNASLSELTGTAAERVRDVVREVPILEAFPPNTCVLQSNATGGLRCGTDTIRACHAIGDRDFREQPCREQLGAPGLPIARLRALRVLGRGLTGSW